MSSRSHSKHSWITIIPQFCTLCHSVFFFIYHNFQKMAQKESAIYSWKQKFVVIYMTITVGKNNDQDLCNI